MRNLCLPASWVALCSSLIASNCCVIQIILNHLSIGCAGFAILDPFRPFAKVATIASVAHMLLHRRTARAWLLSIISIMLLVSQDMLAMQNKSDRPSSSSPLWLQRAVARYHRPEDDDSDGPMMMEGDVGLRTTPDEAWMTGQGTAQYCSLGAEDCQRYGSGRDYKFRVVGLK